MDSPQSGRHDHVTSEIWLVCQTVEVNENCQNIILHVRKLKTMDVAISVASVQPRIHFKVTSQAQSHKIE